MKRVLEASSVVKPTAETHLSKEDLIAAIQNGQFETVKMYVQNNLTWLTEAITPDQDTALHVAAATPHTRILHYIIETLQEHDFNVFQQQLNQANEHGFTPLMASTVHAPAQHVRYLLEQGASVNAQNKDNNSAMHLAVMAGSQEKIDILLEHGADLSLKNTDGNTAQDMVLPNDGNNLLLVKIASLRNAVLRARENDGGADLQPFVTYWPLFTTSLTSYGQTILHYLPVYRKCNKALRRVLDVLKTHMSPAALHALINQYDLNGLPPLHYAVSARHLSLNSLKLLLDYGADIDAPTLKESKIAAKGATVLHFLVYLNSQSEIEFLIEKNANLQIKDANGRCAHEVSRQAPEKNMLLIAAKAILKKLVEQPRMAMADMAMRTALARQSNFVSMLEIVLKSDHESDQKQRHELLARVVLVAPFEYLSGASSKLSMLLKTECNLSLDSNEVDVLCQNLASFLNSQLESSQDKARIQLFLADFALYARRTISTHEPQKFQHNYAAVQTLLTKLIDDVDAVHTPSFVAMDTIEPTTSTTNITYDRSSSAESGQPQAKQAQAAQLAISFCRTVTAQTPTEYILAQFMLINIYQHQNSDEAYSTHAALVAFAADHKDILIALAIEFGLADALPKLASDIPAADQHKKLLYLALTRRCISKEIRSQILQTLIANDVSFNLDAGCEERLWDVTLPGGESNELKKSYKKLLTALRTGDMQTVKRYAEQNLNWIKDSLYSFEESVTIAIEHDQRDVLAYLVKALGWAPESVPKGSVVIQDKQYWNRVIDSVMKHDAINVFDYLVPQGADLAITREPYANTLLHNAVQHNSRRIITALLQRKPALLIASNQENKIAIQVNHAVVGYEVHLSMNCCKGVWGLKDALNQKAETLIRAIQHGDTNVVERYAREAIYWFCIPLNEFKQTAWHIAALAKQVGILAFILHSRKQSLLQAIKQGDIALIRYYATRGKQWFIIPLNDEEQSALDVARACVPHDPPEEGSPDCAEFIERRAILTLIEKIHWGRDTPSEVDAYDDFGLMPINYLDYHCAIVRNGATDALAREAAEVVLQQCVALSLYGPQNVVEQTITLGKNSHQQFTDMIVTHFNNVVGMLKKTSVYQERRVINNFASVLSSAWTCIPSQLIRAWVNSMPLLLSVLEIEPTIIHRFMPRSTLTILDKNSATKPTYLEVLFASTTDVHEKCQQLVHLMLTLPLTLNLQYYDELMKLAIKFHADSLALTDSVSIENDPQSHESLFLFLSNYLPEDFQRSHAEFRIAQLAHEQFKSAITPALQDADVTMELPIKKIIDFYMGVSEEVPWHYIQAQWEIAQLYVANSTAHCYKSEYTTALDECIRTAQAYLSDEDAIEAEPIETIAEIQTLLQDAQRLRHRLAEVDPDRVDPNLTHGYSVAVHLFTSASSLSSQPQQVVPSATTSVTTNEPPR